MDNRPPLSPLAETLIATFEEIHAPDEEGKLSVNALISKVASWYEKLRNAMDYREEEVILRAAIERILKRRLLLGGNGKTVAEPLVRELVWARYFSDNSLSESIVSQVAMEVDLHLRVRHEIVSKHHLPEGTVNEWFYQLMSARITHLLNPQKEKEVLANLIFTIMREHITIEDDSEQTRDAQVFIAVRRSFAKDDIAFLRYHLFVQFFGMLTEENLFHTVASFPKGFTEIQKQLHYPRKDTIYAYVKNKTAAFFILEEFLRSHKGELGEIASNDEALAQAVFAACEARYNGIAGKVQRALIRSVAFIFLTKVFFALAVEGTLENILYGKVLWRAVIINTVTPPLIMIIIGLFIQPPGRRNSEQILSYIRTILFDSKPKLGKPLVVKLRQDKRNVLTAVFTILWLLSFVLAFGAVVFVLIRLGFHPISQGVFLFFLAIVSFLSYRIDIMSRAYTVGERQGLITPVVDFLFMPIVKVGRHLTEGISQLNIFLFVFDFLIEAPFKGLFTFFEQWFLFLHAKREGLE